MKEWKGFKHGINLGGWLSQCDYSKERLEGFIVEDDFKVIKDWGLDHVRVPFDYNIIQNENGELIDDGFKYLDFAVDSCQKVGLNIILDLHKTRGYSFDPGEGQSGFFDSPSLQESFFKLWEAVARRYKDCDDFVAFELLNEVTDKAFMSTWNLLSADCISRIRKIAPKTKILVGGYYNNSVEAVKDLLPPADENIVYNFHCYDPLIFTHQGAPWIATMDTSFRMPIEASLREYSQNSIKMLGYPVSVSGKVLDNDSKSLDSTYFERLFKEAVQVSNDRNAYLYCGEYGVINLVNTKDTLAWYKMISEIFEKYNIGRAAWSYKEMDFGLSDGHMDEVREEILKLM